MAIEDNLMPPNEEEDDNVFLDVLAAPFRGVEGAVQGVYNFLDYATGDFLPDYDQRALGRSSTMAGGVVEGISQFITGFVPVAGVLGKVGRVAKARKMFGSDAAKQLSRGKALPAKQMAAINKTSKKAAFAKTYAAAVGADFLAFNGQEERLSNFLYQYEMFQNPVTEYLKATGDETEIEGRFKNVLEGMFLEIGATALLVPFLKSVKLIKNRGKLASKGMDPEEATEEALSKSDLTQDELFSANEIKTPRAKRPRSKVKGDDKDEVDYSEGLRVDVAAGTALGKLLRSGSADKGFSKDQLKEKAEAGILASRIFGLSDEALTHERTGVSWVFADKGKQRFYKIHATESAADIEKQAASFREIQEVNPDLVPETLFIPLLDDAGKTSGYASRQNSSGVEVNTIGGLRAKGKSTPDGKLFLDLLNTHPLYARRLIETDNTGKNFGAVMDEDGMVSVQAFDLDGLEKGLKEGDLKAIQEAEVGKIPINSFSESAQKKIRDANVGRTETRDAGLKVETVTSRSGFDGLEQQEFDFKLDADSEKSLGFANTPLRDGQKVDAEAEAKATKLNTTLAKKIAVGGEQALLSNIRLVSSESDLVPLVRSLATNQNLDALEGGYRAKTSEKEILEEGRDMSDILGGNKNVLEAEFKKLKESGDGYTNQFNKDQKAIKVLNNVLARKTHDFAIEARGLTKGTDEYERAVAEMKYFLNLTNASQNLFAQFGRTASLAMLQRKYMFKEIKGKKIDPLPDNLTPQDIAKLNDQRLGSMSDEKLIDLVANAKSGDDIEAAINRIAKGSQGNNMMDMVQEYWMNSLLSGPTTQLVNLIGSAVTYAVGTVERTVGSALSGNFALTRATLQYSFSAQAIADAFKLAGRALKHGEAISIPEAKLFDDRKNSIKAINYSPAGGDNAFSRTFNFLGEAIRLPSRGLIGGDEFFKAFNYRVYVQQELAAEAIRKGLRGKELDKYVADRLQGYITDTGRIFNEAGIRKDAEIKADEMDLKFEERQNFIDNEIVKATQKPFVLPDGTELSYKDRGVLAAKAEQMAKINTHTQDSENSMSKMLSRLTQQHPTLKFVIPFVRTPTNLLTYGISRSPFGSLQVLSKDFRAKLRSPDASVRAETRGRLATSVATTASLLYFLQSGKGQGLITGYGPKNKEQRESWEMANQQYSIKVGDKWVSYNRLDPIATILGVVADINEAQTYNELDDGDLEKVFSVAALAFSNNITSKSYVQGLDNLFDFLKFKDPVRDAEKFLGSIAGGFVPNVINQSLNYEEDRPLREARGIIDRMIKRTPAGGNLPPRRNVLGEVMTVPNSGGPAGVFNPLYIKEDPKNVVEYEISNLRSGFRQPSRFLRPGVEELDMKEYYNPETGQQSYDRFLELVGTSTIRGRTLRQSLERMFKSKEYAALSGEDLKDETGSDSPKVVALRRMIRAYRGVAKSKMLQENPELRMREIEAIQKARAARTQ